MSVEARRKSSGRTDKQRTLALLLAELEFVETGGYRSPKRSPFRPPYVFEESPSCPNFSDRSRPHRCSDCWLMEFVTPDLRGKQVPCRFVQLTPAGVTIDSLYRSGSTAETEKALGRWLRQRIGEVRAELSPVGNLRLAANS